MLKKLSCIAFCAVKIHEIFFFVCVFCMFFLPHLPSLEFHRFGSMPGSVCVRLHLKFPALKGVTRRMDFKHTPTDTSPLPVTPRYMQVRPGAWSKPISQSWFALIITPSNLVENVFCTNVFPTSTSVKGSSVFFFSFSSRNSVFDWLATSPLH